MPGYSQYELLSQKKQHVVEMKRACTVLVQIQIVVAINQVGEETLDRLDSREFNFSKREKSNLKNFHLERKNLG